MSDMLLDDVKALLDKDFGDDRILKQICRACERNEVVSNYERNYVRELAEKYLGKKPKIAESSAVETDPVIPIPSPSEIHSVKQTQKLETQIPKIPNSKQNNKKILFTIGGVALAVVVIVAITVYFSGVTNNDVKIDEQIAVSTTSLSIQTDLASYAKKDLISISGLSDTSGTVILSIKNPSGTLAWTEQINVKSDGRFSTLTIAGGSGWERSGTYTVSVDNGVETKSNTFSFTT